MELSQKCIKPVTLPIKVMPPPPPSCSQLHYLYISTFFDSLVVVVVDLSSLVRIWGECLTIHSQPVLFILFYFKKKKIFFVER